MSGREEQRIPGEIEASGTASIRHSSFVIRHSVEVAQGRRPADLALVGGRVVNVFSQEVEDTAVLVADGRVVALPADLGGYPAARETLDLGGRFLAPAFIDAHIHLESAQLWVGEFARVTVPRGTGAVVADPHEVANVLGLAGVAALIEGARGLPQRIFFVAPSCVPASPRETSGAVLDAAALAPALDWPGVVGLGEMMNYPGVLAADPDVLAKLAAARARGLPVDGHAPGVGGAALDAYAAAGVMADHESTELAEARAKLRRGLFVMIRDGSTARNLDALLPLVTPATADRCAFVSDDRDAATLLHEGHLDALLRRAVAGGLDPLLALRLVTLNPARFWRLDGLGAVAPGYHADLVALDDLRDFRVALTLHGGRVVARDGAALFDAPAAPPATLRGTVRPAPLAPDALRLPDPGGEVTVVEALPGQIVTRRRRERPTVRAGMVVADPARDLLKLVVVERHRATGNVGVGLVRGFGLRRGALASSVGHDAHNLVAVGADDADIRAALAALVALDGGLVAVAGGEVLAALPLPLAGLLSDRPAAEVVAAQDRLEAAARDLGCAAPAPFALLSFMPLSVIPEVRVTDQGLVELPGA
ncbi:MAG TPA: adenine deaminase [Thermomicrobiales bacterium]|nr:adenine deaminase [Thermomicrobiales bacterium]